MIPLTSAGIVLGLVAVVAVAARKILTAMVPHWVVRASVLLWPRAHPRRAEILAEFVAVPPSDRADYSAGIVVAALIDGIGARFGALSTRWTLVRLLADVEGRSRRRTPALRTNGPKTVRYLIAFANAALAVPLLSITPLMSGILITTSLVMFIPGLALAALLIADEIKTLIRRLRVGRREVVVMLMADYIREVGANDAMSPRADE